MPPMKYWEIVAEKLSAARLVMVLLQRGYKGWLALGSLMPIKATGNATSFSLTSC
jgi:hypothetical protein